MTTESGPLHLIVMRHAKSEGSASSDHARPLTDQGRSDAQAVGRWLAEAGAGAERRTRLLGNPRRCRQPSR